MFDMAHPHASMRVSPQSHHIYAYTALATTSPRSFVYYVVAAVGPGNSYRPLAVALRQGRAPDPSTRLGTCTQNRVRQVLEDCMRLFDIFTEPSNRISLEAELSLAESWYHAPDYRAPDRVEIPDLQQPDLNFSWHETTQELPELPWRGEIREFPFISTCLRLALCPRGRRLGQVQEQPLGTIFRDDKLEYGMVVLDISDLELTRYGIIGSAVKYMAEVNVTRTGCWDPVEDPPPEKAPIPILEEPRDRVTFNCIQYLKKFSQLELRESTKALHRRKLVTSAALEYIWPEYILPSSHVQSSSAGLSNPRNKRKRADTLDQAIESLIRSVLNTGNLGISNTQESILHPEFQARLIKTLHESPLVCSASRAFIELLRLAYTGISHLNWVSYGNLTYESVAATIQSGELKGATALSLCIDQMGGSADALFNALLLSKSIHGINFLQSPMRGSDELGSRLFAQICASPSGSALLRERRVLFACAYSAPFLRKCWLPDIGSRRTQSALTYTPPVHAFPVQHMFVRQQFVGSGNRKTFRPCYFFLGDALLDPERFAVGFLEYCCSILTDEDLLSFSCSQPTLNMYKKRYRGMRISPIASENFAVPRRCAVASTNGSMIPDAQVECWPMVRDLESGGWVVLVSHEWYVSPQADRSHPRPAHGYDSEVPFIRYAFLRARKHININDEAALVTPLLDEMVGSNYMGMVGGLAEFLCEAAALDEVLLVSRVLQDTTQVLANRWPTGLGPGMTHLSVLEESQARAILRDFIEHTPIVRGNLRMVMQANPEERNWYPELLEGERAPGTQQPQKGCSGFKTLIDYQDEGPDPLGTEMKIYEEPNDDDL